MNYVDGVQLMNIDSGNIQIKHWSMIASEIKKNYDNYDGFVVTMVRYLSLYICCLSIIQGANKQ